jgi:hypothetical protein
MKHKAWLAGIAIAALALVVAGVAWAAESQPLHRPAERIGGRAVRGMVVASEEDRISLQPAEGQAVTVLVTERTNLWVPGQPPTTTVELAIGTPALVFGRAEATETGERALAARIIVVADDQDLPKVFVRGRVVAVTRQTIVVNTGRGERAVTITPRSRLWTTGGRLGSLRAIHPADLVFALGQPNDRGQWVAGLVLAAADGPSAGRELRVKVLAVEPAARMLTAQTRAGKEISILTDDETRFRTVGGRSPDSGAPILSDIAVGDRIVARGRMDDLNPGTFSAREIGLVADPQGPDKILPDE